MTAVLAMGFSATAMSGGLADVRISEIRIDQPGTDDDEYFELVGPANQSLDGLYYIVIGEDAGPDPDEPGEIEAVINLNGQVIGPSGRFLVVETMTYNLTPGWDFGANLNFENSGTVTHMLVSSLVNIAPGPSIDGNGDGFVDNVPWNSVIDAIAIVDPGDVDNPFAYPYGPGPGGTCVAGPNCNQITITQTDPGHFFRCNSTGGWNEGSFALGAATESPFALNPCPPLFANGFE